MRYAFVVLFLLVATCATAQDNTLTPAATSGAVITFDHTEHNFGTIRQGEKVKFRFTFRNTGTDSLRIENVQPTCGCTVPDWTRMAVAPGGTGFVDAEFNSAGKMGEQMKTMTVISNAAERTISLRFKGTVVAPEPTDNPAPIGTGGGSNTTIGTPSPR